MAEEGYLDHWGNAARMFPADRHYAFARKIGDTSKVVLTSKLARSRWDRTVVASGDLVEEVNRLKRQPGGDIITFGGVSFASSLIASALVDELQLFVNPTVVGEGRSIFRGVPKGLALELIQSNSYSCGIVVDRYAPTSKSR